MHSTTQRIGHTVIKTARLDDIELLTDSAQATMTEANIYLILRKHDRIANYLYISPLQNLLVLEFYPHGNLKAYSREHGTKRLTIWARQMIEGVAYIHKKGVIHADVRLDQWLVDSNLDARLSDFNASGHDSHSELDIASAKGTGVERASHFMPRDPLEDNTVKTDLFALGSALYELETGEYPYAEEDDERIAQFFSEGQFPNTSDLMLGKLIKGCWMGTFETADDVLAAGDYIWPNAESGWPSCVPS
ncbi:kinase-like domain-containing protein [Elsinoe ampelina]|uniref:Kinase-like domain-containing protein n=1 Tax=Elsinoe ampelina TaxID=302913 RepID=A0A6A6FXK0_9PEZI|nr:kinase-like domain-containing protein [Elsinoe ampelina]